MQTNQISDLSSQIEHLVQNYIAACRKAAQEAVIRAFDAAAATATSQPTSPAKAVPEKAKPAVRRQSRRRDRAEMQQVSERFYQAVLANPGETMAFLANKLGMKAQELHRPMDLLRQAKKVRSVGQRHFTRYFPMNDSVAAAA